MHERASLGSPPTYARQVRTPARRRLTGALAAVATSLALLPSAAAAAPTDEVTGDISAPTITQVEAAPLTVDVTEGAAIVQVRARITDAGSGVISADLSYHRPEPGGQNYGAFFQLVSGTSADGMYEARMSIPHGEAPGRWPMQVHARDRVGNNAVVEADELEASGQDGCVQVLNDDPDVTPPTVVEVALLVPEVDVRSAPATQTVRIRVTDAGTGTTGVIVFPQGPRQRPGGVGVPAMTLREGTAQDGWWEGEMHVARYSHADTWTLTVEVGDRVNNIERSSAEDLTERGISTQFTVLSEQDLDGPVVTDASLSRLEVDVSDADQTIDFEAHVTDDLSGVEDSFGTSSVQISLQHPLGQLAGHANMPRASGTPLDGTYRTTFTIPRSSATGLWATNVFTVDVISNTGYYGAATAASVGLPPAVLVYNTPLPPVEVVFDPVDAGAVVTWEPPLDERGAEVTDYVIREAPEGREVRVDADTRQAVVPDLTNDVEHTFVVHALNRAGESDPSQAVMAMPAEQVGAVGHTTRLSGTDRIETAVAVAQAGFGDAAANAVVLSRSDDYADALAGTALTASRRAPLLITSRTGLDSRTAAEIRRVLPAGRDVYLLGGEAALSSAVAQAVEDMGYGVVRLAGRDRYATSIEIAEAAVSEPSQILLATGRSFADALGAGAAAGGSGGVVILTDGDRLPAATAEYLERRSARPLAVGGPAAAAVPTATAVVGRDRYETAVLLAQRFPGAGTAVGLATGERFPDALAGNSHAARIGAPLLLTARTTLPAVVAEHLQGSGGRQVYVYGGQAAVDDAVLARVRQLSTY